MIFLPKSQSFSMFFVQCQVLKLSAPNFLVQSIRPGGLQHLQDVWNPFLESPGILRRFLLETMGFLLGAMLVVLCFFCFFSVGVSVQRLQSLCFKYVQMDWVCNMMQLSFVPRPISNRDPTESHDFLQLIR